MQIVKIELYKYKLFVLADFDKFVYTPEHKMVLILGTNGCGKSSLLHELSPLPSISSEFYEGGYKKIEIEHLNNLYQLSSTFNSFARHSFCLNGVELNPSGTGQVQKELVKSHFNYTVAIHDLMTGKVNFTSMTVSERRNWFTQLSNINLTHALKIYNNCKIRQRDLVGGLKIQHSLKHNEEKKLLSEEEAETLLIEIKNINDKIDALMTIKEKLPNSDAVNTTDVIVLESAVDNSVNLIKELLKVHGKVLANTSEEQQKLLIDNLNIELSVLNERLSIKISYLEELQDIKHKNKLSAGMSEDNILLEIKERRSKIEPLKNSLEFTKTVKNVTAAKTVLGSLTNSLHEIFSEIKVNEPRLYSTQLSKNATDTLNEVKSRINNLTEFKKKETANIAIYEKLLTEATVECPKCSHIWSPRYDKVKHEEAIQSCIYIEKELTELLSKQVLLTTYLDESNEYAYFFSQYSRLRQNNPILEFLWSHLDDNRIVMKNPKEVVHIVNACIAELDICTTIDNLENEIVELNTQLMYVKNTTNSNIVDIDIKIQEINEESCTIKSEIANVRHRIKTSNEVLSCFRQTSETANVLKKLLRKVGTAHVQKTVRDLHLSLNEEIRSLKLQLNDKETKIFSKEKQLSIVANYNNSISELEEEKKVVDILVDEISPKDGLIGKIMAKFIDKFITGINGVIASIWTYPFELISVISDDETDLDYKFAAKAEGMHIISDVSKCSSSMKEVIDLAFRLVAFEFLGFDKYALFMDEFGASMDTTHRAKAFDSISRILNSSDKYSQVYVISHHEQLYGSIRNADIIVLNPVNIVLPVNCTSNKNCMFI